MMNRAELLKDATDRAVRELIGIKHRADGAYISLPLLYPSGASVVVRLDGGPDQFFITDFGGAYHEADLMGATTTFNRHARSVAERAGVGFDQHAFFVVEASKEQIAGAIAAVANCSHDAVAIAALKLSEKATRDQSRFLYERLVSVFPISAVDRDVTIHGSTNTPYSVASVVRHGSRETIFDVVTRHPTSIAFASTKFHDIARLDRPPARVAVVDQKSAFGTYLGVLSLDASVIEQDVPDDTLRRLAEAA